MGRRVLVTRPEPGAARTAQRLEQLGFTPILLPLTKTVTLPVDINSLPEDAAAVALTSANAVRHASPALIAVLAHLLCHAVGKKTAEAVRTAGFPTVIEGPGDAGALANQLAGVPSGKTLIYLCGRVRFPVFEETLASAGVHVHPVESYDTVALDYADAAVLALLDRRPVDLVLLYSAKAASAMQALTSQPILQDLFEGTRFFALSARIAAALDGISSEKIHIAPEPDEDALLGLLSAAD